MSKITVCGMVLTLLLTGTLALAFNIQPVRAMTGMVYIRADGSIDPPDAPITTYDNVTYTLTNNITISIVAAAGIIVERDNIVVDGAGHTVQGDGTPFSYYRGVYLGGKNNVTIRKINIQNLYWGIWLENSSSNTISGSNITQNGLGVLFDNSSNNSISGNNITTGVVLYSSSHNTIIGNNITHGECGLYIYDSSSNYICENTVSNDNYGLCLEASSYNGIIGNNITHNNQNGINLYYSSNNSVSGNNIVANEYWAIHLDSSTNNKFYHNNFINNTAQVFNYNSTSVWDDGYPSGGNYWSNYADVDYYNGPNQDVLGSDGIGDTPYNQDRYPLMHPWSSLPVHNINTGLGYATMQEAINANETLDGHTIFAETAAYCENVIVNKAVWLVGEDVADTIVDGGGSGIVVHITADGVRLTNFTIRNSGLDNIGIYLNSVICCSILGNKIENNGLGIKVDSSSSNSILENNITNNDYGIQLYNSHNNVVSANSILNNKQGIEGAVNSHTSILYNNVENNLDGIFLSMDVNDTIARNNVENNTRLGIRLSFGKNHNIFTNNIVNNGEGITIISVGASKTWHNNFIENKQQVSWIYGNNTWDDSYPSGGNYWSDYNGTDDNGDGIGDTPYVINITSNQDNYPLMNPWSPPDIAIINVVSPKTVVGEGCSMQVNVTVMNQGDKMEGFNITLYVNTTTVETQWITLTGGKSTTVTFSWNTAGFAKGNYTISAHVTPVPDEIDITDNTRLADQELCVSIAGDLDADFDVDLYDAVRLLVRYGAKQGQPQYNPVCDIDGDGDIDLYDAVTLLAHYGQKYP